MCTCEWCAAGGDTANALWKRFGPIGIGVPKTRIGISAHLAGLVVGILAGIVFLRDVDIKVEHSPSPSSFSVLIGISFTISYAFY